MRKRRLTRRESILQCAALGSLRVAPWVGMTEAVSALEAQERDHTWKATQWNEIGPFYKRLAPNDAKLRGMNDPGLGRRLDERWPSAPRDGYREGSTYLACSVIVREQKKP